MPTKTLAQLVPIVRGLLAEGSGDEDRPFRNVILRSAAEAGPGIEPLAVTVPTGDADDEQVRAAIGEAIDACATKDGQKPRAIELADLGVLTIEQDAGGGDGPLGDRVALVTGAAGAIGYGICKGLLDAGCRVAATDLPGDRLDAMVEDLSAGAGDRAIGLPMDVTDPESVAGAFDRVADRWGGVDIVIVNAGIAMVAQLTEMDLAAFARIEKVNVEGALLTLAEAGRHMKRQATGGDIVVISTKNVPCPGAGFGAYSSTKAACHQLGRIASLEFAEFDIRVNMVAPDAVFSEGAYKSGLWQEVGPGRMKARGLDEDGLHEYYRNRNLLKARVTARHVANAALFFVTRQTPTTGATIPVDGGLPDATPR